MGNPRPEEREERYAEVFGHNLLRAERELVMARIRSAPAIVDDVVGAAPKRVLTLMANRFAHDSTAT